MLDLWGAAVELVNMFKELLPSGNGLEIMSYVEESIETDDVICSGWLPFESRDSVPSWMAVDDDEIEEKDDDEANDADDDDDDADDDDANDDDTDGNDDADDDEAADADPTIPGRRCRHHQGGWWFHRRCCFILRRIHHLRKLAICWAEVLVACLLVDWFLARRAESPAHAGHASKLDPSVASPCALEATNKSMLYQPTDGGVLYGMLRSLQHCEVSK